LKLLIVSVVSPYPAFQGSQLRLSAVLERLSKSHDIWFLGFTKSQSNPSGQNDSLERLCKSFEIVRVGKNQRLRHAFQAFVSGTPVSIGIWKNERMRNLIRDYRSQIDFNAVFLFDVKMTAFMREFEGLDLYIDLDVSYSRYFERLAWYHKGMKRAFFRAESARMRAKEFSAIRVAKKCFISSKVDREIFPPELRKKIYLLPNVIDVERYPYSSKTPTNNRIVFTGKFSYLPNIDAARFFARAIFPLVRKEVNDATFWIVGTDPSPEIRRLHDGKTIFVTGFVEEIESYLKTASVFVCPLRLGSGTRLKILEAMAMGVPVVTSRIGCEGLAVEHGVHAIVEDDTVNFARAVVEVLTRKTNILSIKEKARAYVESNHDKRKLEIILDPPPQILCSSSRV